MRKVICGTIRHVAGRAFIPLIEENVTCSDQAGIYSARLLSLVVMERESTSIYPFENNMPLAELQAMVPELKNAMEKVRQVL